MIKLKKLNKALLTLDGDTVEVECIGKGRYTTAWANGKHVYLQTHEKDNSKEMLARMPENPHLPQVVELGWFCQNSPYRLYRMPKYHKLTTKHKDAWYQYKTLLGWMNDAHEIVTKQSAPHYNWLAADRNARFEEFVLGSPALPETLRDAIALLVNRAGDYGNYCIEISKRNCAVDDNGLLILLDPCFNLQEVRDDRQKRMKLA